VSLWHSIHRPHPCPPLPCPLLGRGTRGSRTRGGRRRRQLPPRDRASITRSPALLIPAIESETLPASVTAGGRVHHGATGRPIRATALARVARRCWILGLSRRNDRYRLGAGHPLDRRGDARPLPRRHEQDGRVHRPGCQRRNGPAAHLVPPELARY